MTNHAKYIFNFYRKIFYTKNLNKCSLLINPWNFVTLLCGKRRKNCIRNNFEYLNISWLKSSGSENHKPLDYASVSGGNRSIQRQSVAPNKIGIISLHLAIRVCVRDTVAVESSVIVFFTVRPCRILFSGAPCETCRVWSRWLFNLIRILIGSKIPRE